MKEQPRNYTGIDRKGDSNFHPHYNIKISTSLLGCTGYPGGRIAGYSDKLLYKLYELRISKPFFGTFSICIILE